MTAFISGHRNITDSEWKGHYVAAIDKAIAEGHDFIVCECAGADTRAQQYLRSEGIRRVTVYHMFDFPRVNIGFWSTVGGFISDSQRDEACTKASDYDIAWSRTDFSGTWANIQRRKKLKTP